MVRRLCFAAIRALSASNETRERALEEAAKTLSDHPIKELATMAGELFSLQGQATAAGLSLSDYLSRLWSRDLTHMRAHSLIAAAQHEIRRQHDEAERRRHPKYGRRRR